MHIEVQVALNFVVSYLYNKLPRRRVNIFGEELEKALKDKFLGHWYPDKPFKGSAFRCLKTGDPIDKVLERAARESGVAIHDILENLPQELAVWVDPGEVSYRIGEKGAVKILFSEKMDMHDENNADREVTKTFNPEAQCFRPIDDISCGLAQLNMSSSKNGVHTNPAALAAALMASQSAASSPTSLYKGSPSPVSTFIPRTTAPLTFTTATFAQTKFGSTKLKTSSKRANRMSPTEFSNYIKQRAAMQQQLHTQHSPMGSGGHLHHSSGSRALSPDSSNFYFPPYGHQQFQAAPRSMFESSNNQFHASHFGNGGDFYSPSPNGKLNYDSGNVTPFYPSIAANGNSLNGNNQITTAINNINPTGTNNTNNHNTSTGNNAGNVVPPSPNSTNSQEKLDNVWTYNSNGQYQHLLVAN